jgi:hypothetical protein
VKVKCKTIRNRNGNLFISRLSFYRKDGSSYKLHLILGDDEDEPHDHPWDFSSLILFGGYYEEDVLFKFGNINIKKHDTKHKTKLRRIFGIKIPTLTFGIYSEKKQLCSFCREVGHCLSNTK